MTEMRPRVLAGMVTAPRLLLAMTCLLVLSPIAAYGQLTQLTASSFTDLKAYSGLSNVHVTMDPGDYWLTGSLTDNAFVNFSGDNSVFDLGAASFKLDTRDLGGHGSGVTHFSVMDIEGSNLKVNGLNLQGLDLDLDTDPDARRWADRSANYLRITGTNNELNNAHIITAGSNPYGYGDAFGKGAPPAGRDLPPGEGGVAYIGHNKTSGILLNEWADGIKIDGLDLDMFTFGHGVYVQGADNVEIRNSTVTGQLFSSNDVIAHPAYQEYGVNVYGQEMYPDILISGSEDGIRYYGDGNSLPWSENLTIENVEVTNMREAFSLIAARGTVTVDNASAYGNETGFEPGLGTVITNSRADVTNGPLLYYRRDYVNDTDIEIELVGDVPQEGRTWDVAYINGTNNTVTLTSDIDPELLSDEAYVRVGQRFNDWRHGQGDLDDTSLPADGVVVNNYTGQITVLGTNGDNVGGFSSAGTINGGDGNDYDGLTLVLPGTRMIAKDGQALGNNGTAADGSLNANGTIVASSGTLEISPGVRFQDEKLTISGNGVDGTGALYSDGSVDSGTRFGSSSGGDESTIFLDGNASIGVGVAGNQLLIGSLQGTGNFTKRGPGKLSIEKASTFEGSFTVAEGEVVSRSNVVNGNLTVNAGASVAAIGDNAVNTEGTVFLFGTLDINARSDDNSLVSKTGQLFGPGSIRASNAAASDPSTLTIASPSGLASLTGPIQDKISLVKTGTGTQALSGTNTYTGTTTIDDGVLRVDGTHTGGAAYSVNAGGTLAGNGSIDAMVSVGAGGSLAPGASAGELAIGTVELQDGSLLEIEIGGTSAGSDHDLLTVDNLLLGGDLAITLIDSGGTLFTPFAGDSFTVATADVLTGVFGNVATGERIETVGGEGSFLVSYSSANDSVILSDFLAAGLAGDFNADGVVDAADYTLWRDTLGATGLTPFSGADGDGDGQITESDYGVWYSNFGATQAGASTAVASVPEPAGLMVLLASLAGGGLSRRPARVV